MAQGGNFTPNSNMLFNEHVANMLDPGQGAGHVPQQPANRLVGMGLEMEGMQVAGAGRYVLVRPVAVCASECTHVRRNTRTTATVRLANAHAHKSVHTREDALSCK